MNINTYTNMQTAINKKVACKKATNGIWGGFRKGNGNGEMMCLSQK